MTKEHLATGTRASPGDSGCIPTVIRRDDKMSLGCYGQVKTVFALFHDSLLIDS